MSDGNFESAGASRIKRIKIFWTFTTFLTLLLFLGCSQKNPVGPDYKIISSLQKSAASSRSSDNGSSEEPSQTDLQMNTIDYQGERVYKLLGLLGGTLSIPLEDYYCYFYVPPTALVADLILSVQVTEGYNRKGEKITDYDFWPDGLVFEKSSYLEYRTPAADGTPVQLWWFDPEKNAWEMVGAGKVRNHKCTFSIQHFSNYRTWEGSVSASGQ